MDKIFLKRYIEECPLTDFTENGKFTKRQLHSDKYLEKFTGFLYKNESTLYFFGRTFYVDQNFDPTYSI